MTSPWLSIIGLGEDGIAALPSSARALIAGASLVIGGARHLALAAPLIRGERRVWPAPIFDAVDIVRAVRPGPVVALASGDPFCFGVGPILVAGLAREEWRCLPAPSSLSLACARLGWALQDVEVISFCGRPIEPLIRLLQPGVRILALSADETTPGLVATFLSAHGFGPSEIVVMAALGGPEERVAVTTADGFAEAPHALNLLAITVVADAGARVLPLSAGLPDDWFDHDGQITKAEIRAATVAALAPRRGDVLWDIGTGSGSVSIEWLRHDPSLRAIAVERNDLRMARAAANATRLGVRGLRLIPGSAPEALVGQRRPNAVFIGGGVQTPGLIDFAWEALLPGGRFVVNAVTIESEAVLFAALRDHGGTLSRIGVERLTDVGRMHGFRPAMTVTQWAATKP